MKILKTLGYLNLLFFSQYVFSQVVVKDDTLFGKTIEISGEITNTDIFMLEKALKNNEIGSITLNSMGGDVDAALTMGNLIYKTTYKHTFLVGDKKLSHETTPSVTAIKCASSCVFIYASARERLLFIRDFSHDGIIVHSPFTISNDLTYSQIQNNMERIKEIAIRQFERVGVSPTLWSMMVNTPSSKYKVLTAEENIQLGLNSDDPAWDDYRNSWQATIRGINKSEYIRMKSILDECISEYHAAAWTRCQKISGLSNNKNKPIIKILD